MFSFEYYKKIYFTEHLQATTSEVHQLGCFNIFIVDVEQIQHNIQLISFVYILENSNLVLLTEAFDDRFTVIRYLSCIVMWLIYLYKRERECYEAFSELFLKYFVFDLLKVYWLRLTHCEWFEIIRGLTNSTAKKLLPLKQC